MQARSGWAVTTCAHLADLYLALRAIKRGKTHSTYESLTEHHRMEQGLSL